MEPIYLPDEDGNQIKLFVVEETQLSGIKYLLVCESDNEEEDSDAYILKEVSVEGDDVVYEFVEDDVEFDAVAKLFDELVGDEADLEM
ncbi:Protein of unknown function [Pseudobutyrivibrio sp. 49]|uniref:DUF1292 domain-containing protein n=1 Tax=unclassified Pseudobutyrivibrio TaxID=2638619 RepID=UPI00088F3A3D|nr:MULTISPECIES: DUF1292 domain-containing protein [unclassified Pseudobutyrivibrio]SDI67604.1 Protein of unknown function [Pseudobutyrivibrio sp. 49]SFN40388.1 Protein of unknown function [Pseudobutyrivibrio sp. UC1225]